VDVFDDRAPDLRSESGTVTTIRTHTAMHYRANFHGHGYTTRYAIWIHARISVQWLKAEIIA
jgi:hypothetical protein